MSAGGPSKVNLATFMRDKRTKEGQDKEPGPFLTISRQYGCSGYFLGLLLVDLLNNDPTMQHPWKVYQREILHRLAEETDVTPELLDKLRRERPRLILDFFRNITTRRVPGALEIRNRVASIIRGLASEGNAIIIGMGGAGATADLPNGLRIRMEAPLEWRIQRVCEYEGIKSVQACQALQKRQHERDHLRQIYAVRFPREPAFDLVYDCSNFSLAQIAQHILCAMRLKKMSR